MWRMERCSCVLVEVMSVSECCASGSCEVCRRPVGYTQEYRDRIRDYEPPWVRTRRGERE